MINHKLNYLKGRFMATFFYHKLFCQILYFVHFRFAHILFAKFMTRGNLYGGKNEKLDEGRNCFSMFCSILRNLVL